MINVVLVRPETPGNIGFIARSMANFDLTNLILVEPLCNHLDEDALKKSMHAKNILKKAKIMKLDYFFKKSKKEFDIIIGTTSVMGTDYNITRTPLLPEHVVKKITKNLNRKIAFVFGNEGNGLTNKELSVCDFILTIPSSRKYPALNISHASAIVFYEIYKIIGKEKINSHILPASRKEREVILKKMNDLIEKIHFATKEKKETQRKVWKKVFEQSMISKREAYAVMGLLRKIDNKINK